MRRLVTIRRPLGSVTWGSAALRARGLGAIMAAPVSDEPYIPIRGGVDTPVPFEPGTIPPGQVPPGRICPSWGCATNGPTYPVGVFPINYIPVAPAPVPTSDGSTPVTNPPTVVVTPTSGPIPTPAAVTAATAPASNPIADFLSGSSLLGVVPNWALLLAGGALLWAFSEGK